MHVSVYTELFESLSDLKSFIGRIPYPNQEHQELLLEKIKEIEDVIYQDRVDDLNLKTDLLRLAYQEKENVEVQFLHKTVIKVFIKIRIPYEKIQEIYKELSDDPIIQCCNIGMKDSNFSLKVNKLEVEEFDQYINDLLEFLKKYSS